MELVTQAEQQLKRARAWLSTRLPFFAVLALHLPERAAGVDTASTDGETLLYNPEFVAGLSDSQARGLLLHLVLHAAFGHGWRRGSRSDAARWERACDIAVNGVIRGLIGVSLPKGMDLIDLEKESWAVEAIYDALPTGEPPPSSGQTQSPASSAGTQSAALLERWREALALAAATQTGDAPGNVERHYPRVASSVPWTRVLEARLRQSREDFAYSLPDRRMLAHDLVYPALRGEGAQLAVAVDTSGSVSHELIGAFLAELRALRRALPNSSGLVLYADAEVRAVHDLWSAPPPTVRGGGGTSFESVFRALEARRFSPDALVYLTDGEAEFPRASRYPVLWVLPADSSVTPPWGDVVRLEAL